MGLFWSCGYEESSSLYKVEDNDFVFHLPVDTVLSFKNTFDLLPRKDRTRVQFLLDGKSNEAIKSAKNQEHTKTVEYLIRYSPSTSDREIEPSLDFKITKVMRPFLDSKIWLETQTAEGFKIDIEIRSTRHKKGKSSYTKGGTLGELKSFFNVTLPAVEKVK